MTINDIISQRKQFVSNTYQFYTQHTALLDEIKEAIIEQLEVDLEEEEKVWSKWQKKIVTLNQFNLEIQQWMKSQKSEDINQKRIIEISYLKSSFENQAETAKKHYSIFLNSLENKKNTWIKEMALYLVRTINQNSHHKLSKIQVDENLLDLLNYSRSWNNDLIVSLSEILKDSKEIINFCETIIDDIENLKTQNNNNSLIGLKCNELSNKLSDFYKAYDFEDISNKLNIDYSRLQDSFLKQISDSSIMGLRANIKIIKTLNHSRAKMEEIIKMMYEINEMFKPYYFSINDKKKKMINLCVNSQKLEENTAFKWIEANIEIFAPLDNKTSQFRK